MNTLFRNFFYAVGVVLLAALHSLNAVDAQFSDLVRLVQSENAQNLVGVLTITFVAIELMFGHRHQKGVVSPLRITPSVNSGIAPDLGK